MTESNSVKVSSVEGERLSAANVIGAIPLNVQRMMIDRSAEKQRQACLEIEQIFRDFVSRSEFSQVTANLNILINDFVRNSNVTLRKGGLMGISSAMVGCGPNIAIVHVAPLFSAVINAMSDIDIRIRFSACETMFNAVKLLRTKVIARPHPFLSGVFPKLNQLIYDSDSEVRKSAMVLNKILLECFNDCEDMDDELFYETISQGLLLPQPECIQLTITWVYEAMNKRNFDVINSFPNWVSQLLTICNNNYNNLQLQLKNIFERYLSCVCGGEQRSFDANEEKSIDKTLGVLLLRFPSLAFNKNKLTILRIVNGIIFGKATASFSRGLIEKYFIVLVKILISQTCQVFNQPANNTNSSGLNMNISGSGNALNTDSQNATTNMVGMTGGGANYTGSLSFAHNTFSKINLKLELSSSASTQNHTNTQNNAVLHEEIQTLSGEINERLKKIFREYLDSDESANDSEIDYSLLNKELALFFSKSTHHFDEAADWFDLLMECNFGRKTNQKNVRRNAPVFSDFRPIFAEIKDMFFRKNMFLELPEGTPNKFMTTSSQLMMGKDYINSNQSTITGNSKDVSLIMGEQKKNTTSAVRVSKIFNRMIHVMSILFTLCDDEKSGQQHFVSSSSQSRFFQNSYFDDFIETVVLPLMVSDADTDKNKAMRIISRLSKEGDLMSVFINTMQKLNATFFDQQRKNPHSSFKYKKCVEFLHKLIITVPFLNAKFIRFIQVDNAEGDANNNVNEETNANLTFYLNKIEDVQKCQFEKVPGLKLNYKQLSNKDKVFLHLFEMVCIDPITCVTLSLQARRYRLTWCMLRELSGTAAADYNFVMQLDDLVELIETPAFVKVRLDLVDWTDPVSQAYLYYTLYGLLMMLPQGKAFETLHKRLATLPTNCIAPLAKIGGEAANENQLNKYLIHLYKTTLN